MEWDRILDRTSLSHVFGFKSDFFMDYSPTDFDRIVFSSAFRRMLGKTQVHAFPKTDFCRTRLTHSLETASFSRVLGRNISKKLGIKNQELENVLFSCGIIHDIGTTVFGHEGEFLLQEWFKDSDIGRIYAGLLSPEILFQYLHYDGNAQGLRIILDFVKRHKGGFGVSCGVLGSFVKYPHFSSLEKSSNKFKSRPEAAKIGVFSSELDDFILIVEKLGLVKLDSNLWCRAPTAILAEASDDICYTIGDMEDAFKLGKVSFPELEDFFLRILKKHSLYDYFSMKGETDSQKLRYLRFPVLKSLVYEVSDCFLHYHKDIMEGLFGYRLCDLIASADVMRDMGFFSSNFLYRKDHSYFKEIIYTLADFYGSALLNSCDENLTKIVDAIEFVPQTNEEKISALLTFVSGMSDAYAEAEYKIIKSQKTLD